MAFHITRTQTSSQDMCRQGLKITGSCETSSPPIPMSESPPWKLYLLVLIDHSILCFKCSKKRNGKLIGFVVVLPTFQNWVLEVLGKARKVNLAYKGTIVHSAGEGDGSSYWETQAAQSSRVFNTGDGRDPETNLLDSRSNVSNGIHSVIQKIFLSTYYAPGSVADTEDTAANSLTPCTCKVCQERWTIRQVWHITLKMLIQLCRKEVRTGSSRIF